MADPSKTEKPTSKKLAEAKKKGAPPHSRDMTATVTLLVAFVSLYVSGSFMMSTMKNNTRTLLAGIGSYQLTESGVYKLFLSQLFSLGIILAPFMLSVMIAGIVGILVQGGASISFARLNLKLESLNPLKGLKRIFNKQAAVESIKSFFKIFIVGYIAYGILKDELFNISYLTETDTRGILEYVSHLSFKIVLHTCGVLGVLALLDLAYVKWQFIENLKMTKEEVKEEHKNAEGDPKVKAKIAILNIRLQLPMPAAWRKPRSAWRSRSPRSPSSPTWSTRSALRSRTAARRASNRRNTAARCSSAASPRSTS